jgi:hypothetical protein
MSSLLYPNPLENRVHFKLNAAKIHLETLKRLENECPGQNFALTNNNDDAKMQVEMEIDEILYHLVGVKDALLQEINSELQLDLAQKDVNLGAINRELNQRRADAKDITKEIDDMVSVEDNPLWLINELHNHSKHRAMLIKQKTAIAEGEVRKPSLTHPRTGEAIRNDKGEQIPVVEYLEQSYTRIEELQKTVRDKIHQYRI